MSKVVIVGGGASGLVAAIIAAQRGCEVIILERNKMCGKKLLMTGNGKCNYWNCDQNIRHYHSSSVDDLSPIITLENQRKVLDFFDSIGIVPKIKNGYYYPFSNVATSIQYALIKECAVNGVTFIYDFLVTKVVKGEDQFIINDSISCDKIVLACGSKACPKTGSDGIGYELAKSFGHTIVDVTPALVQLRGDASYFKLWNGIRVQAIVTLYIDNEPIKEEEGEIQLTEYGISGICVLNISRYVEQAIQEHKEVSVHMNFIPWFLEQNILFVEWMEERNKQIRDRTVYELMEGFLPYKLVDVLFKVAHIHKNVLWNDMPHTEKKKLETILLNFSISIVGTNSFDKAQVCTGGVSLSEIEFSTMESKIVKNLYIVGELLDVDGDCGGYNLGFAWISGMLAGKGVSHD